MKLEVYNRFCGSLPHTSHVVQWGDAHVWKVGSADKRKVFAIGGWGDRDGNARDELAVVFKVSPLSFDLLSEQPGLRPAPYLASRGMKWIQRLTSESMDDAALKDYLAESHRLVALGLPKKLRSELGLLEG